MSHMKECNDCGEFLPLDNFSKRKSSPDGLQKKCKACNQKDNARFRKNHPDYINNWRIGKTELLISINKKYYEKWGSGVYRITNKLTNHYYIGSSVALLRRCIEHLNQTQIKNNSSKKLHQDILQYGRDNFQFEIIKQCPVKEARKLEAELVKTHQPYYNINLK